MPQQSCPRRSKTRRRKSTRPRKPDNRSLRRTRADQRRLFRKWARLQQKRAIVDHDQAVLEAVKQRKLAKMLLPPVDPRWPRDVLRWLAR
jgi:hypothetical protein